MLARLNTLLNVFEFKSTGKWFVLCGLVGIVAGLGAIAFQVLGQVVIRYTLVEYAGFEPGEAEGEAPLFTTEHVDFTPWLLLAVMAGGGLASGLLVYTFAPEAEGHGTDAAIDAFHNKQGRIRTRIPIIKTLASAITIGTGGSAGREGPIAQIGAGFGSFLAQVLNLPERDRRILLAAGMGAGVGAIFRAPLAGALFAGEILYRDAEIESDVIVPSAFSSIIAYSTFSLLAPGSMELKFAPLFGESLNYRLSSLGELIPLATMSLVLTLVGVLYIRTFYATTSLFAKLPIVPHVRPAIGAALAGAFGLAIYYGLDRDRAALSVLSTGYGSLQAALEGGDSIGIRMLLVVAFGKIVTTSLTIGSGGSGGVFGPSMVIGGCLGAAFGMWVGTDNPGIYAIVGMTGFFGGCAHAPISTIIMVSEMTGEYKLLLPAMWVSALCFLFGRRYTLYEKQVPTRLESPAHRGDFIVDLLEGIRVEEVYQRNLDMEHVNEGTTLNDIVHVIAETNQHYYPVMDDDGRFVGIFSADDVRAYLFDETIWELAVARDVMVTEVVSVTPRDDLNTALRRFTALNLDELPVLDPNDPHKLLGMLRRKETIGFYNRRLLEQKRAHGEPVSEESAASITS